MSKTHWLLSVAVVLQQQGGHALLRQCHKSRLASRKLTQVHVIDSYLLFPISGLNVVADWCQLISLSCVSLTEGAWEQFAAGTANVKFSPATNNDCYVPLSLIPGLLRGP